MSPEIPGPIPDATVERRKLLPFEGRWLDKLVEVSANIFGVSERRLLLQRRDDAINQFEQLTGIKTSFRRVGSHPDTGAFKEAFVARKEPLSEEEELRRREIAITGILQKPLELLKPEERDKVWRTLGELTEEAGLDRLYKPHDDDKELLQAILAHGDAKFEEMGGAIGFAKAVQLREAVKEAKIMAYCLYRGAAWREFTERMLSGVGLTSAEKRAGNFVHKHPVTVTQEALQAPSEFARALATEAAEALIQGEPYALTTAMGEEIPLQVPLVFAHDQKSGEVRFAGMDLAVQKVTSEPPCYQLLGHAGVVVARITVNRVEATAKGAIGIVNDSDCTKRQGEVDLSGVGIQINVNVASDGTAVIETACDHRITDLSPITRFVGRLVYDLEGGGYLKREEPDYLPRSAAGEVSEESLLSVVPDPDDSETAEELSRLPEYSSLALVAPVTGLVQLRETLMEAAQGEALQDPDGNSIDPSMVVGLGTWLTLVAAVQLQDQSRSVSGDKALALARVGSLAMLKDVDHQLGEMHITHLLEVARMIESGEAWHIEDDVLKLNPDFYKLWPKLSSYKEPGSPEDVTAIVRTIQRAHTWVRALAARLSDKVFPEAMGGIIGDGMVGVSRGWPRGSMDFPGVAMSARTQTAALAMGEFFKDKGGRVYSCGQVKMQRPEHAARIARGVVHRMCASDRKLQQQVADLRKGLKLAPLATGTAV